MTNNPYAKDLGDREPVQSMADTSKQIESLFRGWPPEAFERSYAPGKWSARQLLIHLSQAEMIFGERIRFALTTKDYIVQPFDQDEWAKVETTADAATALAAYLAMRRLNLALFRALTPEQRQRQFRHPERGVISVEWILIALAGHDRHHLPHFEAIASAAV